MKFFKYVLLCVQIKYSNGEKNVHFWKKRWLEMSAQYLGI